MPTSVAFSALKSLGLRPPRTLTVAITGTCNLRCLHCWVEAAPAAPDLHVPTAVLRRLLEEFAAMGGEGLRLTGGEPLCHPGWLEVLKAARDLDFGRLHLQTNAMLIGAAEAAALKQIDFAGLEIQVSLDGASEASHDLVRGPGAFKGALEGIRCLTERGLAGRISLFFTEMQHNLLELPELLELAESLGVPSVSSGALVNCGRAAENNPAAPPDLARYERLLDLFQSSPGFRARYARLGNTAPLEWLTKEAGPARGCPFAETPYLSFHGTLYPCLLCHTDDFAVTGVLEKSLADAFTRGAGPWSTLLQISRQRPTAIAACSTCPEQAVCAGGCMGRAWGSCGNLLAADDRCALRRSVQGRKKSSHPPLVE